MKLKYLAIPALISAAFFVAAPANAAGADLGPLFNKIVPISAVYGTTPTTFSDDWTFSIPSTASVAAFAADLKNLNYFDLTGFGATLSGTGTTVFTSVTTSGGPNVFLNENLAPGTYDFRVFGTTSGTFGGGYAGTISAAAVPEPETYAMMMAGLAMMGVIVRRRQKNNG